METVIRFVTLTARRDKLFSVLLIALLAVTLLSRFLGSTALIEQRELAAAYAGWGVRLAVAVGLIVFVCFHVRQAFEGREIEVMLSWPLSRIRIVLGYWLGFAIVATVFALLATLLVGVFGQVPLRPLAVWGASLWLETLLVVAMALFCAFTLKSAVSAVMSAFGLYLMGRMATFFVMATDKTPDLGNVWLSHAVAWTVKVIGTLMPRLDLFAQSDWLVYGQGMHQPFMLCLIQTPIYLLLLLAASMLDFHKREF